MIIDGELHTHTLDLSSTHLGQAIDLLRASRATIKDESNVQRIELSHRQSISSIIHSFAALESFVNYIGFEMFTHKKSRRYIPVEQRDFLLRRFAQSWNVAACIDKIIYLVSEVGQKPFPEKLNQQLRELNTMRNWLLHGFSYTTTFLLQPTGANTYNVIDTEESVDWTAKFPNTKLSSLDSLSHKDASLSLTIVFQILQMLSEVFNQPISFYTISSELRYVTLFEDKFDFASILDNES